MLRITIWAVVDKGIFMRKTLYVALIQQIEGIVRRFQLLWGKIVFQLCLDWRIGWY